MYAVLREYIVPLSHITTLPLEKPLKCIDHTPSVVGVVKPVDLTVPEQQELGYMALRDDFEREYDNEAEQAISDVAVHYTDTPLDIAYKLFEVTMYQQRLRERRRRKEIGKGFSIMHNATMFGWKAYRAMWKKRTREERLFNEHYQKLGRYTTQSDYNKLRNNLLRQDKLQKHIQTLIKFNSQGYKSLRGKLKMHAIQMNGCLNDGKKRKKKHRRYYR